jgi:hypothetical protein
MLIDSCVCVLGERDMGAECGHSLPTAGFGAVIAIFCVWISHKIIWKTNYLYDYYC